MPTIFIDDFIVRLPSEFQNTFNPCYAFGFKGQRGSLALRETQSGHLFLPFDAEGNILITPGRRYQLVVVEERAGAHDDARAPLFKQQQPHQQHGRKNTQVFEEVEKTTMASTAAEDISKNKLNNIDNDNNNNKNTNNERMVVVGSETNGGKKRREREHKGDEKPAAKDHEKSPAQLPKKDKKERKDAMPDGVISKDKNNKRSKENTKKDNDVLHHHSVRENSLTGDTTAADAPNLAAHKTPQLQPSAAVDRSPKMPAKAPIHSPHSFGGSVSSFDDDDLPLTASYARRRQQEQKKGESAVPKAADITSSSQAEEPAGRRQPKKVRRAPVATPSTSDSD